mgnify:CR=1 FL=1
MGTCFTNLFTAVCRVYFQTKLMLMRYSKQLKKNPVYNRKQLKQKTKQKQSFNANPLNTRTQLTYLVAGIIIIILIIIIKTLFQEATHLTTRQSSMRASNNRKQLTNKLTNACTRIRSN